MLLDVGDAEAQGDFIDKGWIGQICPGIAEIVARLKNQFVHARLEGIPVENRRIEATVGIGHALCDQFSLWLNAK